MTSIEIAQRNYRRYQAEIAEAKRQAEKAAAQEESARIVKGALSISASLWALLLIVEAAGSTWIG